MTGKARTLVPIRKICSKVMNQVLVWIGFDVVTNRQALCSETLAEIQDMTDLTEKDITECRSCMLSICRTLDVCLLDISAPNN